MVYGDGMTIEERILSVLALIGPMTSDELSEALGLHKRTVAQRTELMGWDRKIFLRGSDGRYKWHLP